MNKKTKYCFGYWTILFVLLILSSIACNDEDKFPVFTEEDNEKVTEEEEVGTDDTNEEEMVRLCNDCIIYDYNGIQREYIVHVPDNLPENAPLIFILHGSDGIAENYPGWFQMNEIADENGFAVAYPQGLPGLGAKSHWNAGLIGTNVDDVGFLSALAQSLQEQYKLSSEKTFTSGYSNGAFMSYELVAERPDVFKAAASLNGTMSGKTWDDRSKIGPVPILQLSGALDDVIPIDGSLNTPDGLGGAPDIKTVTDFWSELNTCATVDTVQVTPNTIAYKYTDGIDGNEVWYYLLADFGHEFPLGEDDNIHTSALIWEFFSRF